MLKFHIALQNCDAPIHAPYCAQVGQSEQDLFHNNKTAPGKGAWWRQNVKYIQYIHIKYVHIIYIIYTYNTVVWSCLCQSKLGVYLM